MPDSAHIAPQDRLSQYQQISSFIYHVLSVAGAGGLEDQKAHSIYREILDAYSTLDGDTFWGFRDEIIKMLVTPDSEFPPRKADDPVPLGRN